MRGFEGKFSLSFLLLLLMLIFLLLLLLMLPFFVVVAVMLLRKSALNYGTERGIDWRFGIIKSCAVA